MGVLKYLIHRGGTVCGSGGRTDPICTLLRAAAAPDQAQPRDGENGAGSGPCNPTAPGAYAHGAALQRGRRL